MSFDINNTNQSGNLTRDAELTYLQSGTPKLSFTIAVSRSVKKGDGYESVAMFFNCEKIGGGVDKTAKDFTKGRNVSISGELRQDRWTDKEGQPKSKIYIFVEKLVLGRTPRNHPENASDYNPGSRTGQELRDYQEQVIDSRDEFEDDIPF